MAITVDYSPTGVQPVYQPFFFQVQSSNYTQPQFRFVFDVYRNGSLIERVKALPRPGVNTYIFSPASILESYLSYDLYSYSNDPSQTNCTAHYEVKFGEEYGATTAAPVVYPNLASRSGYTFNGTVQYEDYYWAAGGSIFPQYYLKNHFLYPTAGKFLTNAPSAQTISTTDWHTLSVFNYTTSDVSDATVAQASWIQIDTFQTSGGSITSLYYYPLGTGTTIAYKLLHFAAGPKNLNTLPFAWYSSGAYPPINTDTDYAYEIKLWSASYPGPIVDVVISETRRFEFEDCSKYENVRLKFLNRLGAWDYFNFRLVSRDYIESEKQTFKKNLPISYYYGLSVGDREKTVYNSINKSSKKVTSDWINDETSTWLAELVTSPEVYEISTDRFGNMNFLPVIITSSPNEIKKRINDKLFNVEFEYEYSSLVNTQRG